jgi:hypothetical protein
MNNRFCLNEFINGFIRIIGIIGQERNFLISTKPPHHSGEIIQQFNFSGSSSITKAITIRKLPNSSTSFLILFTLLQYQLVILASFHPKIHQKLLLSITSILARNLILQL